MRIFGRSQSRAAQLQFLRQSARLEESAAPHIVHGAMLLLSVLVAAFIAWAATAEIEELAQAPGDVVPNGFVQIVQHFDGGIVKKIMVIEGASVKAGDVLIKLDGVGAQEELNKAIIQQQGLERAAKTTEELFGIQQSLKAQNASSQVKYLEAQHERDQAISDLEQQKEVVARLQGRVQRLEIKAPVAGLVKGLKVNTIGEVVKPGDPLMEILPTDETLVVEARIAPTDMGRVAVGQHVKVKVSSFDYGRFGGVDGTLEFITATTFDGPNDTKYYRSRIRLEQNHVGTHTEMKILPGMTVTAGIITGKKTILGYLLKPVQRALADSLSEK